MIAMTLWHRARHPREFPKFKSCPWYRSSQGRLT